MSDKTQSTRPSDKPQPPPVPVPEVPRPAPGEREGGSAARSSGPLEPDWLVSLDTFIRNAPAEPPARIKDLIPGGTLVLISGPPGAGKTHLALELMRAVALGEPAFGLFQSRQGGAVLIEEEHHPGNLAKRLVGAGFHTRKGSKWTARGVVSIGHRTKFKLPDRLRVEFLAEFVHRERVGLCILDPLADLHDLDEDKASEIGPLIDGLRHLQERCRDCSFVVLHHTTKGSWDDKVGSMKDARGSGRLAGAFDLLYGLTPTRKVEEGGEDVAMVLAGLKNKEGAVLKPRRLALRLPEGGQACWTVSDFKSKGDAPRGPTLRQRVETAFDAQQTFPSFQRLVDKVRGNREETRAALDELVAEGLVSEERGRAGSKVLTWRGIPPANEAQSHE